MPDKPTIPQRLAAELERRGGVMTSETGQGITRDLAQAIGTEPQLVSQGLGKLAHDGVITRDMRGKRTYRVSLAGLRAAPEQISQPRPTDKGGPPRRRAAAKPTASSSAARPVAERVPPLVDALRLQIAELERRVANIEATQTELVAKAATPEQSQPKRIFGRRR